MEVRDNDAVRMQLRRHETAAQPGQASKSRDPLEGLDETGAGRRGLPPNARDPSSEVPSANELERWRRRADKNEVIDEWLITSTLSLPFLSPNEPPALPSAISGAEGIPRREISLEATENKLDPGQLYYADEGGEFSENDIRLIHEQGNCGNAPRLEKITLPGAARFQPATSQAAIQRFEKLCYDNESIVSRAASWGSRRRSLDEMSTSETERLTSGNVLKKFSVKNRSEIPTPFQKPSSIKFLKRQHSPSISDRNKLAPSSLAPPDRSWSWELKPFPVPSINTALVTADHSIPAISAIHAWSESISATSPTSTKSPMTLMPPSARGKLPSKSDPPEAPESGALSLAHLLRRMGPPTVSPIRHPSMPNANDENDHGDYQNAKDS